MSGGAAELPKLGHGREENPPPVSDARVLLSRSCCDGQLTVHASGTNKSDWIEIPDRVAAKRIGN